MKKNTKIIVIAVLVVAVIATAGIALLKGRNTNDEWLYFRADFDELTCTKEFDNEAILYLQEIHNAPFFTFDAPTRRGVAAYSYMLLSQMEKEELSAIKEYTDALTVDQLDLLALQVEESMALLRDMLAGEESATKLFKSANPDEEVCKNATEEDFTELYKYLYEIFDERGVKHEWKLFGTSEEYNMNDVLK